MHDHIKGHVEDCKYRRALQGSCQPCLSSRSSGPGWLALCQQGRCRLPIQHLRTRPLEAGDREFYRQLKTSTTFLCLLVQDFTGGDSSASADPNAKMLPAASTKQAAASQNCAWQHWQAFVQGAVKCGAQSGTMISNVLKYSSTNEEDPDTSHLARSERLGQASAWQHNSRAEHKLLQYNSDIHGLSKDKNLPACCRARKGSCKVPSLRPFMS